MRNEEAIRYGRVPIRVLLRGGPDGWHYVIADKDGTEERVALRGAGAGWEGGDPEPAWWRRRLDETADDLRGHVGRALSDRTFLELGLESDISWFAVEAPFDWEGLVTLRDPDPARFPGKVPPYVVALEPGNGAVLPDAHLRFSTRAADAWTTLATVAEQCGTQPPRARFLCGWAGHRDIRVGRGRLAVSTERQDGRGDELVGEIYGERATGWGGNPELRFRLDGIDLLDDPADDVIALLRDLAHEVNERGRMAHLPGLGLRLYRPEGESAQGLFTGVSLQAAWRHRR
ncbi:hypothetical protein SMC26_12620 [Actinomadura fulvescens]|uniref:Uncharacterized protein n=1 Tax=Actinomadura fulvescens TaxID=46160 RepID=A0ABP6BL69_9ACTN